MKRKKLWSVALSICLSLTLLLGLSGCELFEQTPSVYVLSIEKTATEGLVDTYTVYYSDGTTGTFEITNGADGKDGKDGADGKDGKDGANGKDGVNGKDGADGKDGTSETIIEVNSDNSKTINACLQSVGKVFSAFTEYDESTTEDTEDTKLAVYTGACVVYRIDDEYTYFITNYHVVHSEDAVENKISDTVYCYLYGSEGAPKKLQDDEGNTYCDYGEYGIACTYVGGAVEYDIALLQAKTEDVLKINENVKPVSFAENYYVGQTAITIGNPNGKGISVTEGIVCVDSEYISLDIDGTTRSYRSIRIDTALYPGNSGGGLFNGDGQLIGISNAGNVTDQNINFAIPVEIVKGVAENIMEHYLDGDSSTNGVYKITLGLKVAAKNSKYVYDTESGYGSITEKIVVDTLTDGGIAQTIGLSEGDEVKAIVIDGVSYLLNRYFEIGNYVLALTEGVSFCFEYERNGEKKTTSEYTVSLSDLHFVN